MVRFTGLNKERMAFFKRSYAQFFSATNTNIDNTRTTIPDEFNIQESKQTSFWGNSTDIAELESTLRREHLTYATYTDTSPGHTFSSLSVTTNNAIRQALEYISARENNPIKRDKLTEAYGVLTNPRYYFIVFMCKRLQTLSTHPIQEALKSEYECLLNFTREIEGDLDECFHTNDLQQEGQHFHKVLDYFHRSIDTLISKTEGRIQREYMANKLQTISNAIDNVTDYLISYMGYVLSDAALSDTFGWYLLEEDQKYACLRDDSSSLFENLFHIGSGSDHDITLISADLNNSRIADQILSAKNSEDIFALYNQLLTRASMLRQLQTSFEGLSTHTALAGEHSMSHDPDLSSSIHVTLDIISIVMSDIKEKTNQLCSLSYNTLSPKELKRRGFPKNIIHAQSKADHISTAADMILDTARSIGNSMDEVKKISADELATRKIALVTHTDDLILSLFTQLCLTPDQLLSLQSKLPVVSEIAEKKEEDDVPISALHERFPNICCKLPSSQEAVSQLGSLVEEADEEYSKAMQFLEKVGHVQRSFESLNEQMTALIESNPRERGQDICDAFDNNLSSIKEQIDGLRYHHYHLTHLCDLKSLTDVGQLGQEHGIFFQETQINKVGAIQDFLYNNLEIEEDKDRTEIEMDLAFGFLNQKSDLNRRCQSLIRQVENSTPHSVFQYETFIQDFKPGMEQGSDEKTAAAPHTRPVVTTDTAIEQHAPEVHLQFETLCKNVIEAEDIDTMKETLSALYNALCETTYHVRYYGGKSITLPDGTNKTVPTHIYKMVERFQLDNINIQGNIDLDTLSVIDRGILQLDLYTLRENIMAIGGEAYAHPPHFQCIFSTRHESTTRIYEQFSSAKDTLSEKGTFPDTITL